jgi:hypothetical protein
MNNKNNQILVDIEFIVKTSIYNVVIIKRMIFKSYIKAFHLYFM